MDLKLSVQQSQVLSLKQALSMNILQLGQSELCDFIEKEQLENPVIELEIPAPTTPVEIFPSCSFAGRKFNPDEDFDFLGELNGEEDCESLTEHIFSQIKLSDLSYDEKVHAAALCGFLEETGYILSDISTICSLTLLTPREAEGALAFIQTLEPAGVGARNLSECLCLQLDDSEAVTKKIAADFLPFVANGRLNAISAALKVSLQEVESAVKTIKGLNPKPGFAYGSQARPVFVVPDIIVAVKASDVSVSLSCENIPVLKISDGYSKLLSRCSDAAAIAYLTDKLEKAKWLQQCIENRSKTLLAVANAIVKHQKDFFCCPGGQLKPLKLCDIAAEIAMHESTVSRAVKDKYIQCSHGIIPLKQLFSGRVASKPALDGEGDISAYTIKEKIKKLIKEEDKHHPLSDRQISEALLAGGAVCSRRTVAKYRESMGIPSTNRR